MQVLVSATEQILYTQLLFHLCPVILKAISLLFLDSFFFVYCLPCCHNYGIIMPTTAMAPWAYIMKTLPTPSLYGRFYWETSKPFTKEVSLPCFTDGEPEVQTCEEICPRLPSGQAINVKSSRSNQEFYLVGNIASCFMWFTSAMVSIKP